MYEKLRSRHKNNTYQNPLTVFGSRSLKMFFFELELSFCHQISAGISHLHIQSFNVPSLLPPVDFFYPHLVPLSLTNLLFRRNNIQRRPPSPYNYAKISLNFDKIISKEITNYFLDRASNFLSK